MLTKELLPCKTGKPSHTSPGRANKIKVHSFAGIEFVESDRDLVYALVIEPDSVASADLCHRSWLHPRATLFQERPMP
jgi:hypothetical protein